MRRIFSVILSICAVCALTVSALAADVGDGAPPRWLYDSEEAYQSALAAWEAQQSDPAPTPTQASEKSIESAGTKNDDSASPRLASDASDKYPVGSYVDASGQIWSSSGELLSPDTVSAQAPLEEAQVSPDQLADTASTALPALEDGDTLTLIAGLVSDIATDPPMFYVEDLRPTDPPITVLSGLKALVTSIFGEYAPITTTSVVSETVGNDTHQYLVETVAPGAAGVDYEWVAGVFLFGIMLFCFMKLLGGILK